MSRVLPHGGREPQCVGYAFAKRCTHLKHPSTNINKVSTHIHSDSPFNPLSDADKEVAHRAADAVKETAHDATVAAKDAASRATDTAKEIYQSGALKAGDTLATSKDYVRQNPVPVVLGAIAFGVAVGYLLVTARRKPTFGERYANEPLAAVREALLGALAPVTQRVHEGYDSALDGAGKVMDRVHSYRPVRSRDSLADQIGRFGNNLKFW